jgi:ferritin-like metal-binding protein YciE
MTMTTLEDLLVEQVRDLYDAEKQLVCALPKMAEAASSKDLKQAIQSHPEETKTQVSRLARIFEKLDKPVKGKACKAMRGLVEEGDEALDGKSHDRLVDHRCRQESRALRDFRIWNGSRDRPCNWVKRPLLPFLRKPKKRKRLPIQN